VGPVYNVDDVIANADKTFSNSAVDQLMLCA
jgi:hypothetical protein